MCMFACVLVCARACLCVCLCVCMCACTCMHVLLCASKLPSAVSMGIGASCLLSATIAAPLAPAFTTCVEPIQNIGLGLMQASCADTSSSRFAVASTFDKAPGSGFAGCKLEASAGSPLWLLCPSALWLCRAPLPCDCYAPLPCGCYAPLPCGCHAPLPCGCHAPLPCDCYAPLPCDCYAPLPCDCYAPLPCGCHAPLPCGCHAPLPCGCHAPLPCDCVVLLCPVAVSCSSLPVTRAPLLVSPLRLPLATFVRACARLRNCACAQCLNGLPATGCTHAGTRTERTPRPPWIRNPCAPWTSRGLPAAAGAGAGPPLGVSRRPRAARCGEAACTTRCVCVRACWVGLWVYMHVSVLCWWLLSAWRCDRELCVRVHTCGCLWMCV